MDDRLQGQSVKFDRYRHENDRRQNFEYENRSGRYSRYDDEDRRRRERIGSTP